MSNFALVIEIERHIEILLLSNDCVIVPGLGGFMAHHVEARYDDTDCMFLPPMRTLGFNPQLRINDSLLAQSYIEAYDISYPEALRRIEEDVNEIKQHLGNEGQYELNDIGRLYVNDEGNMTFEPCEAGILSPEIYGLSSFEIRTVAEIAAAGKTAPQAAEDAKGQTEEGTDNDAEYTDEDIDGEGNDGDTIKIKVAWLRNAVAVAAAVAAFFLIATPISNSEQNAMKLGNINGSIITQLMPKDSKMEKLDIAPVKAKQAADSTVSKADSAIVQTARKDTVDKQTTGGYCIVMASCIPKSNADRYVEQLHSDGYSEAYTYVKNKVVRVVYGNYQTEAEAYNELRNIRDKKDFEEAWVYKK